MLSTYVIGVSLGIDTGLVDENKIQHSEARWANTSISEERTRARNHIQDLSRQYVLKDNPDLNRIYNEIISANPSTLWMEDGRHDYFLRPIKEIDSGLSMSETANYGDGYIIVTRGTINHLNAVAPFSSLRNKNLPSCIYNNSSVAETFAHEIAHWKQIYNVSRSNKESIAIENEADLMALEYFDNTTLYGYGGALISDYRASFLGDSKIDVRHDTSEHRYKAVANYISRVSNGRVKIDERGNCKIDGKDIDFGNDSSIAPKAPGDYGAIGAERTMFVAGQIAYAIKHGIWNLDNIAIISQGEMFSDLKNNISMRDATVLAIKNPRTGQLKIIDKFFVSVDKAYKIKSALFTKNWEFFNSLNEEETYLGSILCLAGISKK